MRVLLPAFQFGCLLFLLLVWWLCLGLPVLGWMRGKIGHPCLVPSLKGNTFSFCQLSMMLAVGLSYMAFSVFKYVPSIPTLLTFFIFFIINGCWILSNVFLCVCLLTWSCGFYTSLCLCGESHLLICKCYTNFAFTK